MVYGLNDRANGRAGTMAAEEVARTVRQGSPVTRERAEQRARAYLPVAGHEHCPRCWVFNGIKSPLHYREATDERPETATCKVCGAEYTSSLDWTSTRHSPVRVNLGAVQQNRSLESLARRSRAKPEGVPSAEQEVRRQAGRSG